MLDYIRRNYKVGDTLEITTSLGPFTGEIECVQENYIVLRQPNDKICGIAASDILAFKADKPDPSVSENYSRSESWNDGGVENNTWTSGEKTLTATENSNASTEAASDAEDEKAGSESLSTTNMIEPKVVGHIDLEKLQQIDPKFSHRQYFHRYEGEQTEGEPSDGDETSDGNHDGNAVGENSGFQRAPFVPAKGRITYYNAERRYGFIRDYASDGDLYFKLQQIVDPEIYESVRKGYKVTYSLDHNAQGKTAQCIHLPNTVSKLMTLAEDLQDSRRYYFARGVVNHILEVYPDHAEAKELLDEIQENTPAPRFVRPDNQLPSIQFNPYATYSQAKRAYLSKNYEEAEELYKKALEANEKPESCIKDLVTLYVSRFKQIEDETEKAEARQKAIDFLEAHRDALPDNLTTKQFLALNYYLPILDYENFILVVDEILADPQVAEIISRRVFYLWQKGIALNKLGRSEEALALVNETLELSPRSRQLLNLKNLIEHPEETQKEEEEEQE